MDYLYCSTVSISPDKQSLRKVKMYKKLDVNQFKDKNVIRIITNFSSPTELGFQLPTQNFNPDTDHLTQSIDLQLKGKTKTILVLHDFYSHPLTIAHVLNYFSKYQLRVVCPYMHDIFNICIREPE